jgi:hypothetical protein
MNIQRDWAMPNKETFKIKPIQELIKDCISMQLSSVRRPLVIADAFAGNAEFLKLWCDKDRLLLNDINPYTSVPSHKDGIVFLKLITSSSVDIAIFDPPYSPRQVSECYKNHGYKVTQEATQSRFASDCKDEIARILRPHGIAICCGWNSNGIGKNRGFDMTHVLLVAHGGSHNDTIVTVERKEPNE